MKKNNNRKITSPQSLNAYIKGICDIMRRSGRAGALQYVPELTWMLFLRILDEREEREAEQARAVGADFRPSLEYPYRWRDWAAPPQNEVKELESLRVKGSTLEPLNSETLKPVYVQGLKRKELQNSTLGAFMSFVNGDLIPYLRNIKNKAGATPRQKVISEVFSSVEKTGIDTERNLLDILDKIQELSLEHVDETHMFPISQVYEGLLQKMGEKNNDGGQFFTPREVIRVMAKVINPEIGETVYHPCCGTGGFLAQAHQHMKPKATTGTDIENLKTRTFYEEKRRIWFIPSPWQTLCFKR